MKPDEYVPYGEEWENEILKLPKKAIVSLMASIGRERDFFRFKLAQLQAFLNVKD